MSAPEKDWRDERIEKLEERLMKRDEEVGALKAELELARRAKR